MLLLSLLIASIFCKAIVAQDDSSEDRIVGGRSVSITEAPYQASLQNLGIHFCGGSIIGKRTILTAAHCVEGVRDASITDLTVRVGSSMWSTGGQVKNIVDMRVHPSYNKTSKVGDVAVVILGSPITYGSGAKAIELADGVPGDGKVGIISGWGVTQEKGYRIPTMLSLIEVNSISRKNCSDSKYGYGDAIKTSMICAIADGKDACQGDSGGAYVSKASGKQWGVVSWGRGCARKDLPGVFAACAAFRKWILNIRDSHQ